MAEATARREAAAEAGAVPAAEAAAPAGRPARGPRRPHRLRRWAARAAAVVVVLGVVGYAVLDAYVLPGALFLLRVTDASEVPAAGALAEREVTIPAPAAGGGALRARVYSPHGEVRRPVVLVHGVHKDGIDERRLMPLARKLASLGYAVVTPEIPDLADYEIRARSVDEIERAVLWALEQPGLASAGWDGKVGVMGISFGGGLALSAAGRPPIRERLAFAFSFGGHADLASVMTYLCSGRLPNGEHLPPHIYAQAVLLRQFAERVVPADQVEPLRACVYQFLANDDEAVAARMAEALPGEAGVLAKLCVAHDTGGLGAALAPHLAAVDPPAVLSPALMRPPVCPVYLLHGSVDNVIPPSESRRLGAILAASPGAAPPWVVISDLVVHVELDESAGLGAMLELATFWTDILGR